MSDKDNVANPITCRNLSLLLYVHGASANMGKEQLVLIDLENGKSQDSNPEAETNEVVMCEVPIRSEHCAASLSLADAYVVKKDTSDSAEIAIDHGNEISNISAIPSGLPRRSYLCWGICLLLTSIALLLSVIGASARKNEMTIMPRPEHNDVIKYLHSHNISSHEELTTVDSPRNLAARWLAESDPAQLPIPVTYDYLYVARYVMVLNYFALNGDGWTMNVNFMTDKHVCDWNGMKNAFGRKGVESGGLSCDENRIPGVLDLGKFSVANVSTYRSNKSDQVKLIQS